MKSKIKRAAIIVSAVAFWIAVWQIASIFIEEILLPTPLSVGRSFIRNATTRRFWKIVFNSVSRLMFGFVVGVVIGTVLAVITHRSKALRTLFYPLLTVIRATPVASFIMLALVFIARVKVPAFSVTIMVIPIMWGNMDEGLNALDRKQYEVAKIFNFNPYKKLKYLYLPQIMPFFYSGAVTSLGLGWKAGIAAEVLCTPKDTIGREIYYGKVYIETTELFSWTLAVIIISIVFELLLRKAIKNKTKKVSSVQNNDE